MNSNSQDAPAGYGAAQPGRAVSLWGIVLALLCAAGPLRAQSNVGESAAFVFDTRDYLAGLAAESAVFSFDTRVVDGLGGANISNLFLLDTQLFGVSSLTLAGPATMTPGGLAQFTCTATYSDWHQQNVTTAALWSILPGAPAGISIGGDGIVQTSTTVSGGNFTLHASYQMPNGQRFAEGTVAVGSAFTVRARQQTTTSGGSSYTVNLHAAATGASGAVTYHWHSSVNGVDVDLVGADVAWNLTSMGGRYDVSLDAMDASGHHAPARQSVFIDKASVPNQPGKLASVTTAFGGSFLDASGLPFQFDAARVGVGLIVITHDLNETGDETWARNLAAAIEQRLPAGSKPNILIYDWRADSDPTRINLDGIDLTHAVAGPEADAIIKAAKRLTYKYATTASKASKVVEFAGLIADTADKAVSVAEFVVGPLIAGQHGLILHDRLLTESNTSPPRVDFTKPIHFIGKGVGGQLVARAALSLKLAGKNVDCVTMLDTTMSDPSYYKDLPNPTVVEHITSSYKGDMEWPTTWLTPGGTYLRRDAIMDSLPDYFGVVFLDLLGGLPVIGGLAQDLAGLPTAHDLAPYWYRNTAVPNTGLELRGFYNSPFIAGLRVPHGGNLLNGAAKPSPLTAPADFLSGFTTFGNVSSAGGVYTMVESGDAGIFEHITIPSDVEKLRFKFRFTGISDGDCLALRFGPRSEIYVGLDLAATRGDFTTAEVQLGKYAGMMDDLVFTLVSRGQPGEIVELKEIEIIQNDDVDGDGLTTAQELALGTNPQSPDTDGDGLDDAYEVNVSHTNPALADSDGDGQNDAAEIAAGTDPLDSHSVFAVTEFARAGGGFLLRWSAVAGKTYRILRSGTVDFASFDVIASGVAGVVPVTTYNDTTISTVTTTQAFYRIEAE